MDEFKDKTVLIVDDEPDIRDLLKTYLEPSMGTILEASNGLEALNTMKENQIHILIADVNMPEMNGLELLGKIRWYYSDVFIVVISGDPMGITKKDDIVFQGYNFLSKPFSKKDLFEVLSKYILQDDDLYIRRQGKKSKLAPGTRIPARKHKRVNVSKKMKNWLFFYKLLVNFRKKHEDRWPKYREVWHGRNLGYWVSVQRKEYRKKKDGEEAQLSDDQIELLDEIDFAWEANQVTWKERFEELKKFRNAHPDRWPRCLGDEEELGVWCSYQRTQYKKFRNSEKSNMTQEKIDLLNRIGFEWVFHKD